MYSYDMIVNLAILHLEYIILPLVMEIYVDANVLLLNTELVIVTKQAISKLWAYKNVEYLCSWSVLQ